MTRALVPAALAIFLLSPPVQAQAGGPVGDLDRQVRALVAELDRRWNARDAEPFSRLFTADADFRIYGRRHDRSRDEVRRRYEQSWPRVPPGIRHQTSVGTVRPLAPGVALLDGEVAVGEPDASASERRLYHYTAVAVLRDGEWLFDAFRVADRPPPPR
jgi:uncharacterized protein (TIGR02246 family)